MIGSRQKRSRRPSPGSAGAADYYGTHATSAQPYWFELNWWFPQLAMLFIVASILVDS